MHHMDCPHEHDFETAERYVSGTLPEHEQAAFEAHYFSCERCFADVRALQEVWQSLRAGPRTARGTPIPSPATVARAPWSIWSWGALAAAALVALAVVASTFWSRAAPDPAPRVATRPPQTGETPGEPATGPVPPQATPSSATPSGSTPASGSPRQPNAPGLPETSPSDRAALLRQLAVVVAPPFVRLATRGAAPSDGDFDRAMAHYAAGRYAEAASGLRATAAGPVTTPVVRARFFLGICELMQGRAVAAREELTAVIASGIAPYADEAHFYLAKAALASGDLDAARRELAAAVDREAGPDGEAARLLSRLR
jgi:TolA-binding protein